MMDEILSSETVTRWCSAPGCMLNIHIAKRHFFRFPKERDRWMEWIKACNRMDLVTLGPQYANQYYRLCHLHFRVEMFRNIEGRIYLNKEAIPSIFLKPIAANNKSIGISQPISFVTIYLKPESRNKHSKDVPILTKHSQESKMQIIEKKDTPIISSLQALFPRASIKQVYDKRNVPTTQTTLLEVKSEPDNVSITNTSTAEVRLVRDICTNSVISMSSSRVPLKETFSNNNGPKPTDFSIPTTSKAVSLLTSSQENDNKTPIKKHWHASTQTPWIDIDAILRKRKIEKPEICIETSAAKWKKQTSLNMEVENVQCLNASQFKAVCGDLLPRNSALLFSACVDARERGKIMKHSFEGQQFALKLFLTASSAYRFYRPLCLLPTVRQLWRHVRNWDMPTGLSDNVLNALRLKLKSLPIAERRCCLCVKEMQLRPHLFYNLSRDRIVGFHDTSAEKRRCTLARKALVIMARSLAGDWEQPLAYYLQSSMCNADVAKNLIFQTIIKLKNVGATVHALVTGTAPTFLRLSQRLGISGECSSFLVDGERVFYIFDAARLIRMTRNILMSHEIRFREKRASWTDIEQFFRRDNQMRLPLVPKLTVAHLKPNKRQKTETKYAVQVFSSSLAAGLSACIASGEFPLEALGTAEFIRNFDQLFDILNSSTLTKSHAKDSQGQAFTGSVHEMCFLQQMLDFLKSIRVIDENGIYLRSIKCFDRWQVTINAVIHLWSTLKDHQFPFLCTKRLNQEGIERIFCSIRRQSGNRIRLTPILFIRAFKNLVSKYLLEHSNGDDSTENTRKMLKRIAALSAYAPQADQQVSATTVQITLNVATTNYRDTDLLEKITFKRLCEYLLDECSRAHNCDVCVAYMREAKRSLEGTPFSTYISGLEDVFMHNFEKFAIEENLGARILQIAQQIKYKPPCPDFPVSLLLKLYLRMRIYITLLRHNKICKNTETRNSLNVLRL